MTEFENAMLEESKLQTKILLEIQNAANKGQPPSYDYQPLSSKSAIIRMIILIAIAVGGLYFSISSFYQAYG